MASIQPTGMAGLDALDDKHAQTVKQAIANILATELAEFTYAQILDGLPTEESLLDSCDVMRDHPVCQMKHTETCKGVLNKARTFLSHFDPSTLLFGRDVLAAFQSACPGSKTFNLRLIELVVVACHQIGADLFELDDGAHKHELHNSWFAQVKKEEAQKATRPYVPPPAAFFHRFYCAHEQYPRGVADVAGYWAEGRIFGGVVVFGRGESEQECKDMWMHDIRRKGPRTLYPPTADQFEALVAFFLAESSPETAECPLPIYATRLNRPRWDPVDSINFHIFRDRYERRIPSRRPAMRINYTFCNWPELEDEYIVFELERRKQCGQPIDEELLERALETRSLVTESSPNWQYWQHKEK